MFVNQIVCPVDAYHKSVNVDNARCYSKSLIFISNLKQLLTVRLGKSSRNRQKKIFKELKD